ncbi:MAG: S9 family peptidase [Rickettsiaceae bacterium]|nr:S9 family peptidase [Rickettsiaceae bacterium]
MRPTAKKIPHNFEIHNTKISDDYAWMRDKNWPKSVDDSEILDYLKSENKHFEEFITPNNKLKNELFEELKGRIKLADQSTYIKRDDYYYYTRTTEKDDYSIYCRKHGSMDAEEEILLDVNKLAKDKKFTALGSFSVSPDHRLIAYSVDFNGSERYLIRVFDIDTGKYLPDEVPETIGNIVWHEKINGFFYTPTDENWRHNKVYYHELSTNSKSYKTPSEDLLIFEEKDDLFYTAIGKSSSKEYIVISVQGHDQSESYVINMYDLSFKVHAIKPRKDKIIYSIDHNGEYFYMITNEQAKNFHILRANVNEYQKKKDWQVYINEQDDKFLSGFDITKDYLLLNYKHNALPLIKVRNLNDESEKKIKFPDSAYTANVYSTNFKENDIRVSYSSLGRPSTTYNYDFDTEDLAILKQQEIPSGFNPDEYNVERIFTKTDNVSVPITIFYKKSLFKKDGSNPLYLYGYGSYGTGIPPSFRNSAVSLANKGFVYAIAHVRGGNELGYEWYKAAKFLTKKRTFNDFIAVSKELINKKYTKKGNIVIMGGSAGGLLIGNAINNTPELYKAAIAHVPFVDVINTMLDETLPLTPPEFKEWGNPKDKEYFEYMLGYSPYDNIKKQDYPHLFVTAGLSDPRVGYWEAAKWVAKINDYRTNDNMLLLKTNMDFGHMGASGRFDYLKEAAEDLVFIFNIFQIK